MSLKDKIYKMVLKGSIAVGDLMKTGKEFNIISKCFLFMFVFLFSSLSSFAAANSISGINVEQIAGEGYKILLKLYKNTPIKKTVDSQGNLLLVLNSTLPSDSMEIVYDNAVDLNNIIVQKKNADNTLILIQGKNIENSKIYTKELSTGAVKQADTNSTLSGGLLFAQDKKSLAAPVIGMMFLFFLLKSSRPDKRRKNVNNINKTSKSARNYNADTLRNKNLIQSKNAPSISYRTNGSFNSLNACMTTPEDLALNNNTYYEEEQIRKAG